MPDPTLDIHFGDNLEVLRALPAAAFELVYVDPPFNTGKRQTRRSLRTRRAAAAEAGDRTGFGAARYVTEVGAARSYADAFDDYLGFLRPRLVEALRVLAPHGSLFVHLDAREVHYVKVMLDELMGRDSFINEIIWAYDYGGRSKSRWSGKHDNILWYAKDPAAYTFDLEASDRIPYMAPSLVGAEKAARGKTPTDTWWHTIVSPTGKEKTGYPTQKPRGVIDRIVAVHSRAGDRVLDFFAGSGTLGESALALGRSAVLVDSNPEALRVMAARFAAVPVRWHGDESLWRSPDGEAGRGAES